MSDRKSSASDKAEAAAIRRRWITLGEGVAVVALVISALTLWNNWSQRTDSEAAKQAESSKATARAVRMVLVSSGGGDALVLRPASPEQTVQSQTILFPSALDLDEAETTGEPRIESGWFQGALNKARKSAGLPGDSRGDERLPVAIVTQFLVDSEAHEDVAIYDVGYSVSDRLIGGNKVSLRGISLVSRVKKAEAQAKLDARWKKLVPVPAAPEAK